MGRSAKSLQILSNLRARPPTQLYLLRKSSLRSKFLRYQRYKGYQDVRAWILLLPSWFLNPASSALKDCTIRSDSKQRCQLYFLVFFDWCVPKRVRKGYQTLVIFVLLSWFPNPASSARRGVALILSPCNKLGDFWGLRLKYCSIKGTSSISHFITSFFPGFGLSIEYRQKNCLF